MAGQLYNSDIDDLPLADWLAAYQQDVLPVSGYVEIWSSINSGYAASELLGTYRYVSGQVKIDRANIMRRTVTDLTLLNDPDNDPSNLLLPVAGTDGGQFSPYGNEVKIFKGIIGENDGLEAEIPSGDVAVTLPLTIVEGVNDQFVYTSTINTGGAPDIFTMTPGTCVTMADVVGQIDNAMDSSSVTFDTYADAFDAGGGFIGMQVPINGAGYNGDTITEGNGGAAAFGFTADPDTFAGGTDDSSPTAYAQLGVFLIQEVDIVNDENGLVFKGTMNDRMAWLQRLAFTYAWSGGDDGFSDVTNLIGQIIQNAVTPVWGAFAPFPVGGEGGFPGEFVDIATLAPLQHFAIGDDPAKLATDLAANYGCALYFDAFGVINLEIVADPATVAPCVEYLEGTSTSATTITRALNNQNVPNIICIKSGGTSAAPAVTVWWWDSYPGSPGFYADAPGDWAEPQYTLPPRDPTSTYSALIETFTTNVQQGDPNAAQAMALACGLTSIGSLEMSTFTLRDQPAHDVDDVITSLRDIAGIPTDPDLVQGDNSSLDGFNYILDTVTIDLSVIGDGVNAVGRLVWAPS